MFKKANDCAFRKIIIYSDLVFLRNLMQVDCQKVLKPKIFGKILNKIKLNIGPLG